jgi:hypothetical protein
MMRLLRWGLAPLALALAAAPWLPGQEPPSPIKADETVVFFPTLGWPVDAGPDAAWEIDVHGCIFEPGRRLPGANFVRELTGIDETRLLPEEALILGLVACRQLVVPCLRFVGMTENFGRWRALGRFSTVPEACLRSVGMAHSIGLPPAG